MHNHFALKNEFVIENEKLMESIDILKIQMYASTTLKISENKAFRTLKIETKEKEEKLREIWNTTK